MINVKMTRSAFGPNGVLYQNGQNYALQDDEAQRLIGSNAAVALTEWIDQPMGVTLTASQTAAVQALVSPDGILVTRLADAAYLTSVSGTPQSSSAATSTTAVVALTPTAVANACRLAWADLKPPKGATTDATGYAANAKTITLASAGTGAFYAGDVVTFAGQSNEYTLLTGDSDVSGGGSISLVGVGLFVAIAASATAITLVRRGPMLRLALNCDNDVEGLLACNTPSSQDASVRLGETVMLRSDVTISQVHAAASVSVLANNHRIEAAFGV